MYGGGRGRFGPSLRELRAGRGRAGVVFRDVLVSRTVIPEAGFGLPNQDDCASPTATQRVASRSKLNKNKGVSNTGLVTANGYQAAQCHDVDAFRMTICTNLRVRGKGLAPGFVKVVPTCL